MDTGTRTLVYLLHFSEPPSTPEGWKPSRQRHYVGISTDFPRRIYDHLHNGSAGSQVTRWAVRRGYGLVPAVLLHGATHADELRVKRVSASKACPLCGGDPSLYAELVPHARMELLPDVVPVRRR